MQPGIPGFESPSKRESCNRVEEDPFDFSEYLDPILCISRYLISIEWVELHGDFFRNSEDESIHPLPSEKNPYLTIQRAV